MSERNKGRSLLKFPTEYIVIDIETTDFDYFYGDIIEIHAEKFNNGLLLDTFSTLIKPNEPINEFISDLTGITNEMIEHSPLMNEVSEDLISFIENSILVAHNANFDINFLYDALFDINGYQLRNDFVDTLRLSRRIVKDVKNHKLITLAKHFDLPLPTHRAAADVTTTNLLYKKLNSIYKESSKEFDLLRPKYVDAIDFTKITNTVSLEDIDKSNYFFGKHICITGKMDVLTKSEAAQILANLGATNQNNVTADTDILVLGNLEYQHERYGKKSSKHLKAETMNNNGYDIEIQTEQFFLDLISY